MQRILRKLIFLSFLSILLLPENVSAKKAYIENITTTANSGEISVSAKLVNGFNKNITEAIQSGISITLRYYIEVRDKKALWFDKKIISKEVIKSVNYNTLTKEYFLTTIKGKNSSTKHTKDFNEIKNFMNNFKDVKLSNPSAADKNKVYIRVRAETDQQKLWFPLNYVLFFIKMKDINTPWQTKVISGHKVISTPSK